MPHPKRLHYYYVGPYLTHENLCRDVASMPRFWLPGRKPASTMDPSKVTCVACKKKMARLPRPAIQED